MLAEGNRHEAAVAEHLGKDTDISPIVEKAIEDVLRVADAHRNLDAGVALVDSAMQNASILLTVRAVLGYGVAGVAFVCPGIRMALRH
jgi:hypothetical protein